MDKGIRIGSWGQLQGPHPLLMAGVLLKRIQLEWKVDMDKQDDTHRHLSHLIGLYPGYALTNYDAAVQGGLISNLNSSEGAHLNYTKSQVLSAAEISLIHRGNGSGSDANSGWEKVWRAACWAQLGNATEFYHELTVRLRLRLKLEPVSGR